MQVLLKLRFFARRDDFSPAWGRRSVFVVCLAPVRPPKTMVCPTEQRSRNQSSAALPRYRCLRRSRDLCCVDIGQELRFHDRNHSTHPTSVRQWRMGTRRQVNFHPIPPVKQETGAGAFGVLRREKIEAPLWAVSSWLQPDGKQRSLALKIGSSAVVKVDRRQRTNPPGPPGRRPCLAGVGFWYGGRAFCEDGNFMS